MPTVVWNPWRWVGGKETANRSGPHAKLDMTIIRLQSDRTAYRIRRCRALYLQPQKGHVTEHLVRAGSNVWPIASLGFSTGAWRLVPVDRVIRRMPKKKSAFGLMTGRYRWIGV